jgi:hypothetical protein
MKLVVVVVVMGMVIMVTMVTAAQMKLHAAAVSAKAQPRAAMVVAAAATAAAEIEAASRCGPRCKHGRGQKKHYQRALGSSSHRKISWKNVQTDKTQFAGRTLALLQRLLRGLEGVLQLFANKPPRALKNRPGAVTLQKKRGSPSVGCPVTLPFESAALAMVTHHRPASSRG